MRQSRFAQIALLLPVAVLLATPAASARGQEAAAPPPQPEMSEAAAGLLDEAVAGTHQEDLELKVRPAYFPSLQGGTMTMVAFETSTDGLTFTAGEAAADGTTPPATADLEVFAAVVQGDQEMERFGGPFALEEGAGEDGFSTTHSFGTTLSPGTYELVWGVRDVESGAAATRRDTVEVPSYVGAGLQLTSVLVSTGVTQTREPMVAGAVFPGVRVANLLVQDDVDRVFDPTRQVELIYIVMGAQADPATGTQRIENNYRILDDEGNSLVRFPPQELTRITVGQPIPLARIDNLEAGAEYRFEIVAKDLVAEAETSTTVPFRIAGEPAAEE